MSTHQPASGQRYTPREGRRRRWVRAGGVVLLVAGGASMACGPPKEPDPPVDNPLPAPDEPDDVVPEDPQATGRGESGKRRESE